MEKLTCYDYIRMPIEDLCNHPDYSAKIMKKVSSILQMTTDELEKLNLGGNDGS